MICIYIYNIHMGGSENRGTPKSSILIRFSIINHPFWGTPIFGNTHIFTWNPNDPCFDGSLGFLLEGLTFKNRGHWGSRYTQGI